MAAAGFFDAIERELAGCMVEDDRVLVIGEDAHMYHRELYALMFRHCSDQRKGRYIRI